MGNFLKLGKSCPVCGGTDRKKRCAKSEDTGLIFCRSLSSLTPELKLVGQDKHGFNLWAEEGKAEEIKDDRWVKDQKELLARQQKAIAKKINNSLTVEERDREIRKILAVLRLEEHHKQLLSDRGLTENQIIKNGYRSIRKFQKLSTPINTRLAGINRAGNRLDNGVAGILCPVINEHGLFVGLRLNNLDDPSSGKYLWISSSYRGVDNQIPVSSTELEHPLAVHYPDGDYNLGRIGICEGPEYKSAIAANLLKIPVIGIPGNNFCISPQLLKKAIGSINENAEIIFIPDSGINAQTATSYLKALQKLTSTAEVKNLKIAWWEQWAKESDIDEINPNTEIKSISIVNYKIILNKFLNPEFRDWVTSRKFTPDIKLKQEYFNYSLPEAKTITFIKSGLGTGKTTQLNRWIKELENHYGLISLGYRNTLLRQFCANNNFYHIHDKDALVMRDDQLCQIALCVDSLLKFEPEDFDNKVIILDEVMSVVQHLLQSQTIKNKDKAKVANLFKEAVKRANRVICLDGNLSDYVVDFFQKICPEKQTIKIENISKIERNIQLYSGSVTVKGKINNRDKSGINKKILESRRPAIVSDSQNYCEIIDEFLSSHGYKTLRIDSTTTGENYAKEFLDNCDAYLEENQPDALIISPSAESGVDIAIKDYFSDLFVIAHGVLGVNSIRQISQRIRDKQVNIHLWANQSIKVAKHQNKIDLIFDEAKAEMSQKYKGLETEIPKEEFFKQIDLAYNRYQNSDYTELINRFNKIEHYEKDGVRYTECLIHAFKEAGFKVLNCEIEANAEIREEISEAREVVLRTRANHIFNAEDIDPERLKNPLSHNATQEEKYARAKARIEKQLPGIKDNPIWNEEFIYQTQFKHPEYLNQINNYFLYKYPELLDAVNDKKMRFFVTHILNNEDISLWHIMSQDKKIEALRKLKLEPILDNPGKEWLGNDPELIKIHRYLRRASTVRAALGIGKCTNSAVKDINKCLKHIGFRLVMKWAKRNKERVRLYLLENNNKDLQDYDRSCFDLTANRWQIWIDKEIQNLQSSLEQRNSENEVVQKISELFSLHALKKVTLSHNILNNSQALSDPNPPKTPLVEFDKDRLELLTRKLNRKTFVEGVKITPEDKKIREWMLSSPLEVVGELISWVKCGREAIEQSLDSFSSAIQYQLLGFFSTFQDV